MSFFTNDGYYFEALNNNPQPCSWRLFRWLYARLPHCSNWQLDTDYYSRRFDCDFVAMQVSALLALLGAAKSVFGVLNGFAEETILALKWLKFNHEDANFAGFSKGHRGVTAPGTSAQGYAGNYGSYYGFIDVYHYACGHCEGALFKPSTDTQTLQAP